VYVNIHPIDKFQDLDRPGGLLRKAFGEEEQKRIWDIYNAAVKKTTSELRKARPDLSSKN
jgi:hypothetical protein